MERFFVTLYCTRSGSIARVILESTEGRISLSTEFATTEEYNGLCLQEISKHTSVLVMCNEPPYGI